MAAAIHSPCERLLPIGRGTSVVDRKSLTFRWCRLRPRCKERGGGDVVTSLTTSDAADRPRPAPARRVAGGEPASASLPLLDDVPHRLRRGASHLSVRRPQRKTRDSRSPTLQASLLLPDAAPASLRLSAA